MSSLRFKAVEKVLNRTSIKVNIPSTKVSDYYNSRVFNDAAMKNFLDKEAYEAVCSAIMHGEKIDRKVANQVASGMKNWAMSHGVTHYTHWFQPLTGSTAEKHDAFFEPTEDGRSIEKFAGSALVQQEPDASSFPNGGLRNTFEARGYTGWDPSSPAFMMEGENSLTLCIPTIFVSYTGEALDYKAPLLKALHAVENAVVDVCSTYFDKSVTKAWASLGIEQEYFLVDEAFFNARPDLMLTGRTLLGHSPEKGQQLEDHYFGTVPPRVLDFMVEFEVECYKLGIPLKTRHNEVAPGQFECAPNFEEVNLAIDHNQLLMDVMDKVAKKHGLNLVCTPGNDVLATTGMAGAGATVQLFTTGLGTPTGNPISPMVKLSTNTRLAEKLPEIIDIDCGPIISGEKTVEEMGEEILDYVIRLASGEINTKAMELGQDDFMFWRRGVSL